MRNYNPSTSSRELVAKCQKRLISRHRCTISEVSGIRGTKEKEDRSTVYMKD
jgi:hypothetical protein